MLVRYALLAHRSTQILFEMRFPYARKFIVMPDVHPRIFVEISDLEPAVSVEATE